MKNKTLKLMIMATYIASTLVGSSWAQDQVPRQPVAASSVANNVIDVSLGSDGMLKGQVLSADGQAVDGARVIISQNKVKLVETVTSQTGIFAVMGMKSGLYQIDSPHKSQLVRVWSHQIAPENAKTAAILVQGDSTVRAQFGYIDPVNATSLILGITGVTLAAITLGKVNDIDDRISP